MSYGVVPPTSTLWGTNGTAAGAPASRGDAQSPDPSGWDEEEVDLELQERQGLLQVTPAPGWDGPCAQPCLTSRRIRTPGPRREPAASEGSPSPQLPPPSCSTALPTTSPANPLHPSRTLCSPPPADQRGHWQVPPAAHLHAAPGRRSRQRRPPPQAPGYRHTLCFPAGHACPGSPQRAARQRCGAPRQRCSRRGAAAPEVRVFGL
jgi:hypothetical protein